MVCYLGVCRTYRKSTACYDPPKSDRLLAQATSLMSVSLVTIFIKNQAIDPYE